MKMTFILLGLLFICASFATAQKKDYHKIEVSGGYSIMMTKGVVGDGDVFSSDLNDPIELPSTSSFPTSTPGNGGLQTLFPTTAPTYQTKYHRQKFQGFNGSVIYNFSKYVGVKFEMSGNYGSGDAQTASPVLLVVACLTPGCTAVKLNSPQISQAYRGFLAYSLPPSRTNQNHYNHLGGVQIKNNSTEKKFKPFAHALAGISRQTVNLKDFTDNGNTLDRANDSRKIFGTDKLTNTGFTMEFGGGIDIRLNNRVDIRVVQVDYNPVKINEKQILAFKEPITGINIPNSITFTNTASADFTQYSPYDIRVRSRWQNNFRIGFGIVFH